MADHALADDLSTITYRDRNIAYSPMRAPTASDAQGLSGVAHTSDEATSSSTLRFAPVELAWKDLTFDVPSKKSKAAPAPAPASDSSDGDATDGVAWQWEPPPMGAAGVDGAAGLDRVLHSVSGVVRPGEMLAILGSSGAGKSTLLNLLAGRMKSSKACVSGGQVLVNGVKRDFSTFKKLAAYVEQDDSMFATLTVEEQIRFAALLRLPKDMSMERKLLKVDQVIQELGLRKSRNTVIGNQLVKGVSGGERKRCSIGLELVTDPSLIILDEPTTGLDSFSALNVITSLKKLASSGRTIVTTIHQPRSSIFALFDKLLILSEGRTMYFGPAKETRFYFANLGFPSPPHFNVADYVIDALSIDYRSKELETKTKTRVLYLADQHRVKYDEKQDMIEKGAHDGDETFQAEASSAAAFVVDGKRKGFALEFSILFQRVLRKFSRDIFASAVRLGQAIVFGILLGLVWLDSGRGNTIEDLRSLDGVMFFVPVNAAFDGGFSVIFDYPLERAVLMRERAAGSYRILSYYLAGLALDIIKAFIFQVFFVTIVYWTVGLRADAGAYFFVLCVSVLMSLSGEACGQTVSVVTGDAQISSALVPLVMVFAFLFAGFFIRPDAMPSWLSWGRNCSFMYWGYQAIAHNEFDFRKDSNEIVAVTQVLKDFNSFSRWTNLGVLIVFCIGFKALFFTALALKKPKFNKSL